MIGLTRSFSLVIVVLLLTGGTPSFAQSSGGSSLTIMYDGNNSLYFDGVDDQVVVPPALLDGLSEFTISVWLRPLRGGTIWSDHFPGIWWESVELSTTWFIVNAGNGTGTRQTLSLQLSADSVWHHYVAMWDGNESSFYVDGSIFAGPVAAPDAPWATPSRTVLGGPPQRPPFEGYLDEMSLWRKALTAGQIERVMADTLGPAYYATPDSGLIAYWRFDEPDGDEVYDATPNENDAALAGAARTSGGSPVHRIAAESIPGLIRLLPNYPNPFSGETRFTYTLSKSGSIDFDVFDVTGRKVARWSDGVRPAGTHAVSLGDLDVAPGVYLLQLTTGGHRVVRRIVVAN